MPLPRERMCPILLSIETGLTLRKTSTPEYPEFRCYSGISGIPVSRCTWASVTNSQAHSDISEISQASHTTPCGRGNTKHLAHTHKKLAAPDTRQTGQTKRRPGLKSNTQTPKRHAALAPCQHRPPRRTLAFCAPHAHPLLYHSIFSEGSAPSPAYDAGAKPPPYGLRCAERARLCTPQYRCRAARRHRTPVRAGYGPRVPAQALPRHLNKAH
jgi:hypothetical protein